MKIARPKEAGVVFGGVWWCESMMACRRLSVLSSFQVRAIKRHLLNLLRRGGVEVDGGLIGFARVGKGSPAHTLALRVYRGGAQAGKVVGVEEILREFKE